MICPVEIARDYPFFAVRSLLPSEALFRRSARDAAHAEKLSSKQVIQCILSPTGGNMGRLQMAALYSVS